MGASVQGRGAARKRWFKRVFVVVSKPIVILG